MSVSTVQVLHGILFPGAQFLSELTDTTPAANIDMLVGKAAGHPDPLFLANQGVKPDVRFNTPQLKTILDLCSTAFVADLSGGNTDLFYKQVTNLGVRLAAATTSHLRFRMASSVLYWTSIGAQHQQIASLAGRIVPIYNGTNAPIVPAGSLALSGTPAAAEYYTLGPVVINTVTLPGVQSWTLDLGIRVMEVSSDGDVYTTFCAIQEREPVLEVTSLETGAWATYGLDGTAVSALVFYLRKKAADGGNVANGTTGHMSFTAGGGKIMLGSTSAGGNEPAGTTLRIPLRAADSSGATVTINTNTTIA
jgi:hypothetical protein